MRESETPPARVVPKLTHVQRQLQSSMKHHILSASLL